MKISFAAFALLAACVGAYAQQAAPNVDSVEPPSGKIGVEVTATGQNLQKEMVAKLYLTDGKNDIQVEVTRADHHDDQVQDPSQGHRPNGAHGAYGG